MKEEHFDVGIRESDNQGVELGILLFSGLLESEKTHLKP